MKIGALSESQVSHVVQLLEKQNISYRVEIDHDVEDSNDQSLHNNLRHYSSPNLSTDILAIYIDDQDFNKLDEVTKSALNFSEKYFSNEDYESLSEIQPKRSNKIHIIFNIIMSLLLIVLFSLFFVIGYNIVNGH